MQDGKAHSYGNPPLVKLSARILEQIKGKAYVDARRPIGNQVFVGFQVNRKNRFCKFYCFAVDDQGMYVARSFNGAVKLPSYTNAPLTKLRMKRVISLAQTVPIGWTVANGMLTGFSNALGPEDTWKHTPKGYRANSSSVVNFISFQKARLWTGGSAINWPQSINGGRVSNGQNGDNYRTIPTVTLSGTGQETGIDDNGEGEICTIHH